MKLLAPPPLRPYQEVDVARIRAGYAAGAIRICYQLPTGGGKTIIFCYILAAAVAKGARVIVLAHRIEILEQIVAALTLFGIPHGIIAAGYPETPDAPVQVASVFTLARRLGSISAFGFDFIVIDECHHAVASTWRCILAALPDARILGVSATPERLDGKGLNDIFEDLISGPSQKELIERGFLAPFTAFGPRTGTGPDLRGIGVAAGDYRIDQLAALMGTSVVISSAVSEYRRLCPGAPAIAFCVDIAHSQAVTRAFVDDGWRAAHLDGNTPREENSPAARHCSECGAALLAADPPEPSSGAGKIRLERASVLSEIDAADEAAWLAAASYDTAIHWAGHDQARLRLVARARGYKPGWVYYRLKEGNHVT
jgi:superfamily II DNA or RNA helicase